MKKKLLTLFLVCAMLFSMAIVANAGDAISGGDALKNAKENKGVIIDVRATATIAASGHVGTYEWPLFDAEGVTDGADDLAQAFTAHATDPTNKADIGDKEIYILCNSGKSGAEAATKLLKAAGYEDSKLRTITNGAKSLQIRYEFLELKKSVSNSVAIQKINDNGVVILDVRNNKTYNEKGQLPFSLHIPVFGEGSGEIADRFDGLGESSTDSLSKAFVEGVQKNAATLQNKDIYILCNSGSRGAKAATVLLKDAGYPLDRIYTIEGGASVADPELQSTVTEYKFIEGKKAVESAADVVVIDVRTTENFNNGTIPNALSIPLFDANGVTNGADALARNFYDEVKDNTDLQGKTIYVLCNSGARGAQAATQLLSFAGYDVSTTDDGDVYTIDGGAKSIPVRYSFIDPAQIGTVENPKAVEAVGNDKILILNVRKAEDYAAGHLKGALSLPVFSADGVVTDVRDDLAVAFTDYVKANFEKLNAYEAIYVMCNSGSRGAQAATVLLTDAGIDLAKIKTVIGGANGESVKAKSTYVTGEFAVSKLQDKNYLVLDVRSADKVAAKYLEGALSIPLFDKDNNLPDDLAKVFVEYVKANKAKFEGKTILVLCNGGARGAAKATELLNELGYLNVFTIENGAKDAAIQAAFSDVKKAPATGDTTPIMIYAIAMVVSALVIVRKRAYR